VSLTGYITETVFFMFFLLFDIKNAAFYVIIIA